MVAPIDISVPCIDLGVASPDRVSYVLNGWITSAFICFGLIGSLTSCILLRFRKRTRFVKLLFTLCFWDVLLLGTTLGLYPVITLITGRRPWSGWHVYAYLVFYPLINWAMTGCKWMIFVVTLERFAAFSSPFRQRFREHKSVKSLVAVVALWSLLCNAPTFFELTTQPCFLPSQNRTLPQISITDLRRNKIYNFYYRVVLLFCLDTLIPFMLVLCLTVKVLLVPSPIEWTEATSIRASMRQRSKKWLLMMAVVAKFLISYTGPIAVNMVEIFDTQLYYSKFGMLMVDLANFLVVLHSATNWLLFSYWKRNLPNTQKSSICKIEQTEGDKLFSDNELRMIAYLWYRKDPTEIGTGVLRAMLDSNPRLNVHIEKGGGDAFKVEGFARASFTLMLPLLRTPKLPNDDRLGMLFGKFLDDIVTTLVTERSVRRAREKLRKVGERHRELDVNLRNADWAIARTFLLDQLLKDRQSAEERAAVAKYVAFTIHEIKCGFLCHNSHAIRRDTVC